MSRQKEKTASSIDPLILFLVLPLLFFIPFIISYYLTNSYLERKSAVSLEEEVTHFEKVINLDDLNSLYGKNHSPKTFSKDKVVVLAYHQVKEVEASDSEKARLFITSPEVFEEEMKLLRDKGYSSISLTKYIEHLNNRILHPIPEKSVVITFDDGYSSQYKNAFPVLKKYGFTATFFLYMDCIDKYPTCLTSGEIKEMTESGMTLANHTLRHTFLTEQKDSLIRQEILDNEKLLQEKFGIENIEKILAYPYGVEDERVRQILKDLGYIGGAGVTRGVEIDNKNVFNLYRYLMGNNLGIFEELF